MEMALSFSDADAARIENCAALMNMSAMDFVRGAALERVEQETASQRASGTKEINAAVDSALERFQKAKGRRATAEDMPELLDLVADIRIERIAAERLSKPTGECVSFDEMLSKCGLTRADLDAVPEDEIE